MRLVHLGVLAFLAGCSFDSASAIQVVDNSCSGDADCVQGICNQGFCVDVVGAAMQVTIEVVSPATEAQPNIPASWSFDAESVARTTTRDLTLPTTRTVIGVVRWEGERVPASLRFVRRLAPSALPLQPTPVEVDTLRDAAGGEGEDAYDYTTVLVAGETYDLVVSPSADIVSYDSNDPAPALRSLPPLYQTVIVEPAADPMEPLRFDVEYSPGLDAACADSQATLCTLEARVVSMEGDVEVAEPGLQVRAIGLESGAPVSSVAETDAEGRFSMRIGPESTGYLLRIGAPSAQGPFPSVSIDPETAFAEGLDQPIVVPRLAAVPYASFVRDVDGAPIPGATVRFTSGSLLDEAIDGISASFSTAVTTGADGAFAAQIFPSAYSVTVTPPEDVENGWGVLSVDIEVGEDPVLIEPFTVPPKVELVGVVESFQGNTFVGATISARARLSTESELMHRSQEAASGPGGDFRLQVDVGLYDVQVKVPSESGFPWLVEPALIVSEDLSRTYRLPPPIPIEGTLMASDGSPVFGARLRAYVLSDDGLVVRPIQVAETQSAADGSYRLLMAPSFGGE